MTSSNVDLSSVDIGGSASSTFQSSAPIGDQRGPFLTEVSVPSIAGTNMGNNTAATSQEHNSVTPHENGVSDLVKEHELNNNNEPVGNNSNLPQPPITAPTDAASSAVSNAHAMEHGTSLLRGSTILDESPAVQVPLSLDDLDKVLIDFKSSTVKYLKVHVLRPLRFCKILRNFHEIS